MNDLFSYKLPNFTDVIPFQSLVASGTSSTGGVTTEPHPPPPPRVPEGSSAPSSTGTTGTITPTKENPLVIQESIEQLDIVCDSEHHWLNGILEQLKHNPRIFKARQGTDQYGLGLAPASRDNIAVLYAVSNQSLHGRANWYLVVPQGIYNVIWTDWFPKDKHLLMRSTYLYIYRYLLNEEWIRKMSQQGLLHFDPTGFTPTSTSTTSPFVQQQAVLQKYLNEYLPPWKTPTMCTRTCKIFRDPQDHYTIRWIRGCTSSMKQRLIPDALLIHRVTNTDLQNDQMNQYFAQPYFITVKQFLKVLANDIKSNNPRSITPTEMLPNIDHLELLQRYLQVLSSSIVTPQPQLYVNPPANTLTQPPSSSLSSMASIASSTRFPSQPLTSSATETLNNQEDLVGQSLQQYQASMLSSSGRGRAMMTPTAPPYPVNPNWISSPSISTAYQSPYYQSYDESISIPMSSSSSSSSSLSSSTFTSPRVGGISSSSRRRI